MMVCMRTYAICFPLLMSSHLHPFFPAKYVKVHKLNEMGEIVDKKGHRAWEMASGLQLGIRVMVRIMS